SMDQIQSKWPVASTRHWTCSACTAKPCARHPDGAVPPLRRALLLLHHGNGSRWQATSTVAVLLWRHLSAAHVARRLRQPVRRAHLLLRLAGLCAVSVRHTV